MTDTIKSECDRGPFTFDWSDFYVKLGLDPNTNPITSSVWLIDSGDGVLGAEVVLTPQTSVFLDGASVVGNVTVLENSIEIQNGTYKNCQKLFIKVVT